MRSVANWTMVPLLLASMLLFGLSMAVGIHEQTPGFKAIGELRREGVLDEARSKLLLDELRISKKKSDREETGTLLIAAAVSFFAGVGAIACGWMFAAIEWRIAAHAKQCPQVGVTQDSGGRS